MTSVVRYARKVILVFILSTISRWRINTSATQCFIGALLRMLSTANRRHAQWKALIRCARRCKNAEAFLNMTKSTRNVKNRLVFDMCLKPYDLDWTPGGSQRCAKEDAQNTSRFSLVSEITIYNRTLRSLVRLPFSIRTGEFLHWYIIMFHVKHCMVLANLRCYN